MSIDNPTILGIETATSCCSVALLHDEKVIERYEVGNNIHSKVLLGMVDSVLTEAEIKVRELDSVAVGQGPGSFTGLRIGVGVGQGIAYGARCSMIGVSSLEILAQRLLPQDQPIVALAGIDARMGEIYWAKFYLAEQAVTSTGPLNVTAPGDIECDSPKVHFIGNAWSEYWGQIDNGLRLNGLVHEEVLYPKASDLVMLAKQRYASGQTLKASDFAPVYVRNDIAKKSTKALPGKRV